MKLDQLSMANENIEMLVLKVDQPNPRKLHVVGLTIYRPPNIYIVK